MNQSSFTCFVLLTLALHCKCLTAQSEHNQPTQHFIVVGVNEGAPFGHSMTVNSAIAVADALEVFNHEASVEPSIQRLIKDPSRLGSRVPSAEAIKKSILDTLAQCNEQDECWFYFCGHGCDIGLESFLVPADVDPSSITRMGLQADPALEEKLISVNWIAEQMHNSEIREGIIVVDACRIQLDERQIDSEAPHPFDNISILTSCSAGQRSLLWPKRHSALYSYWLVHGLKGGADQFTDGRITPYELGQFLEERVAQSLPIVHREVFADSALSDEEMAIIKQGQNPTYSVNKYLCSAELSLSEVNYSQAMTVLQHHVYDLLYSESHTWDTTRRYKVAINEFLEGVADGKVALHGPNGCLGQIATEGLTSQLRSRGVNLFDVVSPRVVRNYLLGAGAEIHHPPTNWDETDADYFLSTLFVRSEDDQRIQLESKLFRTGTQEPIGRLVSFISINPEIEAVMGHTERVVPPHSHTPISLRPVANSEHSSEGDTTVPDQADVPETEGRDVNDSGHPLAIDTAIVPEIEVYLERKRQDSSEDAYTRARQTAGTEENERVVIVQKDDQIRIRIRNPSNQVLAVVPMVDGITTLGKRGGLTPEIAVKQSLYFTIQPGQDGTISGWMTRLDNDERETVERKDTAQHDTSQHEREQDGAEQNEDVQILGDFECRDFIVTAPPSSVAHRLGFGADLGEIRVVVYHTRQRNKNERTTRSSEEQVGIGEGLRRDRVIEQDIVNVASPYEGARVIVIRYQKAEDLFRNNGR